VRPQPAILQRYLLLALFICAPSAVILQRYLLHALFNCAPSACNPATLLRALFLISLPMMWSWIANKLKVGDQPLHSYTCAAGQSCECSHGGECGQDTGDRQEGTGLSKTGK